MKVLGLLASPYKDGNSALMLKSALEACKKNGAEVETIYLADHNIPPCKGCLECREQQSFCVYSEEVNHILYKIKGCDALIMSTPVWWFCFTSYLKLLVDHFVAFFKKDYSSHIQGKKIAVLTVGGGGEDTGTKETIMVLKKIAKFLELKWVDELRVVNVYKHGEIEEHPTALEQASKIGHKISSE